MTKVKILGVVVLLGWLGAGCGQTANDNDAIRVAIDAHLAGNSTLNTSAFNTEVQKIDIQGDQAKADVAFHLKDGPGTMQLTYNLKKTGATWAVVQADPMGSTSTHPTPNGTMPGSAPPMPSQDIFDAIHDRMASPAK